ncbi:BglG family transcription antiterminator [Staphylococcus delphini]|uniref:BglG family transcription antiterminator n=1 Tax=Staphylococcus delphini TaxID=53344 RepID=UPI00031066E2|nr:PRD domain-containing protein [Staphylococcus delphini]
MKIQDKQLKIIESLLENDLNSKKLAFNLEVSHKTLGNYINALNEKLEDYISIQKRENKFTLIVKNDRFSELLKEIKAASEEDKKEIFYRKQHIIEQLLKFEFIKIDTLSEQLFISINSVNQLLKEIREELKIYNVSIEGITNVGLKLQGNELNLRMLVLECFPGIFEKIEMPTEIQNDVRRLKNKMKLDEESYKRLYLSAQIVYSRIINDHRSTDSLKNIGIPTRSNEFLEVKKIFQSIQSALPQNVDIDLEIALIVIQLLGRRASRFEEIILDKELKFIDEILEATIKDVNHLFHVSINQKLFTKDIKLHIKHLINRMIFNIHLREDNAEKLINQYPFAYELSKILSQNIENKIGLPVHKNELVYLTIYFSIYLEVLEKQLLSYKSIVIVTNEGLSAISFLKQKIKQLFKENVIIRVVDIGLDKTCLDEFDLILSTQKLDGFPKEYVYIENVYDFRKVKLRIEQFLLHKEREIYSPHNNSIFLTLLNRNSFMYLNSDDNYLNLIEKMVIELDILESEKSKIITKLIDRENKNTTKLNKVGFPHTHIDINKIIVRVAVIKGNNSDLKIIILVLVPMKNVNEAILIKLYEEILSIANNKYLLNELNESTTFEDFIQLVSQEMG